MNINIAFEGYKSGKGFKIVNNYMADFNKQIKQAENSLKMRTRKAMKREANRRKTTLVRIRVDLHDRIKNEARSRKIRAVRLLDEVVASFFEC